MENNRQALDFVSRTAADLQPWLDQTHEVDRTIRQMRQDMSLPGILARQQAAFATMAWRVLPPTAAELAETQARLSELVPETEQARVEVASEAAEIQADTEGRKLVGQIADLLGEALGEVDWAAAAKVGFAALVIGWLIFYVVPAAMFVPGALFIAAMSLVMQMINKSG